MVHVVAKGTVKVQVGEVHPCTGTEALYRHWGSVQALRICTGRTAHSGSRGINPLFRDHSNRRGWEVSVMPRPLFTPGKDPVPIVQEKGTVHTYYSIFGCVQDIRIHICLLSTSEWWLYAKENKALFSKAYCTFILLHGTRLLPFSSATSLLPNFESGSALHPHL